MFGQPIKIPAGVSTLPCNGNLCQKGSVTLVHVHANALDTISKWLFWAIITHEGMIAVGI
jgi:hypothetical protein